MRKLSVPDAEFYLDSLRAALSDLLLDAIGPGGEGSQDARQAALRLAFSLGWCRLFAIDPGEWDGSLTIPWALAATHVLTQELDQWIEEARILGSRWDECDDLHEADDLCFSPLQRRMDAWAAYLAIDEAYLDCQEDSDSREREFTVAVNALVDRLNDFDEALEAEIELLSLAANSTLLDYWRHSLIDELQNPLPWWLDGRLERVAQEIEASALATMPGPEAWKERRRILAPGRSWGHPASRLPFCEPSPLAAAASPGDGLLPGPTLRWLSPDRAWRAELILPQRSSPAIDDQRRPLVFTHVESDAPATDLSGSRVLLAEVEQRIDAEGKAWFKLRDLRSTVDLILHVGDALDLWKPEIEES